LKSIFNELSKSGSIIDLDDPSNLSYTFKSDKGKEWEIISKNDFVVTVKKGVFIEIFYSPYFDEVL